MRVYLVFFLFLSILRRNFTYGQTDSFDYECSILQRLVTLENEVTLLKDKDTELTQQNLELTKQNAELTKQLRDMHKDKPGTTYIRWGRTTCPGNGSELVYHGAAGGSHHDNTGGAANYLCMPLSLNPEYGDYSEPNYQYGGAVYGVEYRLNERMSEKFFPDFVPSLLHNDVPCAVCLVFRKAMCMVPAKLTCPDGWTLEYKGFLMSGNNFHNSSSEYICMDGEPEVMTGGASIQEGRVLKMVESRCGILPCPPYKDGLELTCSVCTI